VECDVDQLAEKVREAGRLLGDPEHASETEKLIEDFRICFVKTHAAEGLLEARAWIRMFKSAMERAVRLLGAQGVLLPRELRSFINDPQRHLVKKLFNYAYEYARGKMSYEEFKKTAEAAIRTSIRSNMRSIYEGWVFLTIAALVAEKAKARLVFPEHSFILLERSGRQRGGRIPPNIVVRVEGRGYVSLFLEAPRPIGWGDSRDLTRIWKLYVALRPDIIVYRGVVLNILRPQQDPPILRPDLIIECKELSDWFVRSREVRGPLAAPMTAEEWRSRWLRGLWTGLSDILGFKTPEEAYKEVRKRRGVRLTEPQIVKLYVKLYQPTRGAILVSREKVPREIKRDLEESMIRVIDGVGFNSEKLRPVAEEVLSLAGYRGEEEEVIRIPAGLAERLSAYMRRVGASSFAEAIKRLLDTVERLEAEEERG